MAKPTPKGTFMDEVEAFHAFAPTLDFGPDKLAETGHVVKFVSDEPREKQFVEKKGSRSGQVRDSLIYDVLVYVYHDVDLDEPREMALIIPKKKDATLTRGIKAIRDANGGTLEGAVAEIRTENYEHDEFGMTRRYVCRPAKLPEPKPEPTPESATPAVEG